MATKKNRMEKGRRADPNGSKPHSYGESFSRSGLVTGSQKLIIIRIRAIIMVIRINRVTIFSWGINQDLMIGSH